MDETLKLTQTIYLAINESEVEHNPSLILTAIKNCIDIENQQEVLDTIECYITDVKSLFTLGGLLKGTINDVFFFDFNKLQNPINIAIFTDLLPTTRKRSIRNIISDFHKGELPSKIKTYIGHQYFIPPMNIVFSKPNSRYIEIAKQGRDRIDKHKIAQALDKGKIRTLEHGLEWALDRQGYDIRIDSNRLKTRSIALPLVRLAFRDSILEYATKQENY